MEELKSGTGIATGQSVREIDDIPAVKRQMEFLGYQVARLGEVVDEVLVRLDAVTKPAQVNVVPDVDAKPSEIREVMSPLAESIWHQARRVQQLADMIGNTSKLLEL